MMQNAKFPATFALIVGPSDRSKPAIVFYVVRNSGNPAAATVVQFPDGDDELNTNPPTPCLGKRPQRPKPKGPGRPWGQEPLAHGRTVAGVRQCSFLFFWRFLVL